MSIFNKKFNLAAPTAYFILLASLIYLSVLIVNDGFMALDEYWVGITRYIPAQTSSVNTLVTSDDVKSPLQMMPMHGVAQLALKLGVESPYWQYRSVIFVLGFVNFILLLFAFIKFSEIFLLTHPAFSEEQKSKTRQRNFLLLMLTFYFAAPFGLTRPMYESVAAPWLALGAVWALKYDVSEKLQDLLWGVVFASAAFILRQQLGFCALTFIVLTILKKNLKHFLYASGLGLIIFILAGIPDYFLRGQFHFSLLNLTVYNYQHGADYGQKPITFYPVLIFAICLTPFFIKKYPAGFISENFKKLRTLWIFVFLFVFLHSLFPQKWERFIISLVPILIFLVFPFLYYLQVNFQKNKYRLIPMYNINGIVFFIASFFPAQKNLIDMSLYLDMHPEIKKIYRLHDTPGWITEAFIRSKNFQFVEIVPEELLTVDWKDCSQAVVIGEQDLSHFADLTAKLKLSAEFHVNLIEQIAYKLNPKNNARRVKLSLFSSCVR